MILGYTFSIINYAFYGIGRFMKKKSAILAFCLLSLLAAAISCYFFNSLSGYYLLLTQIVIVLLAYIKEKKPFPKVVQYAIYVAAQLFITLATIFTFQGISSIFCYISVTIGILSNWWFNEQKIRNCGVAICFFSFLYNMSIKNYIGVLELAIMIMNIVSYCIYKNKLAIKET